jgi:hypothetical protein
MVRVASEMGAILLDLAKGGYLVQVTLVAGGMLVSSAKK